MANRLMTLCAAVLTVCAVFLTIRTIRPDFLASRRPVTATPALVSGWEPLTHTGQRLGPANAKVEIITFSDFQCPVCKIAAKDLAVIRAKHPTEIAEIYHHFPLTGHGEALGAAIASECAAKQNAFQAFHDLVFFAKGDSVGLKPWTAFAHDLKLDTLAFGRCYNDPQTRLTVLRDSTRAKPFGVYATPTLIINGLLVQGIPPNLDSVIEAQRLRASGAQSRPSDSATASGT